MALPPWQRMQVEEEEGGEKERPPRSVMMAAPISSRSTHGWLPIPPPAATSGQWKDLFVFVSLTKKKKKKPQYVLTFINIFNRVQKDATAASVISDAATALGLDPGRLYVLAEVKECGGEEWVLEAADLPVQRFLLWPRKAQEQHPQSLGFYFLLQVKITTNPFTFYCQTVRENRPEKVNPLF